MKIVDIRQKLLNSNLQEELHQRINLYHDLCGQPLTGTPAEGLLAKSLLASGFEIDWQPMSHNQEKDMIIKIDDIELSISQKGCKENKTRIPISSYRTTSVKSLEEKLDLIEKLDKSLDAMIVFSRMHIQKEILPDYYKVYIINPEYLNPKKFQWKETYDDNRNLTGYRTYANDWDINMGIVKKMSDQLWIDISKDNIAKHCDMISELVEIKIK